MQTVRDALNSAMAEEMDRDKTVFVIGEEVARYNGAYKVTKGLLDRFGEDRVIDVSIDFPLSKFDRGCGGGRIGVGVGVEAIVIQDGRRLDAFGRGRSREAMIASGRDGFEKVIYQGRWRR